MSKQEARNTAAGMVRDALVRLTEWDRVQDLRQFENTKEEAARLLDMAQDALAYFEAHYDFPEDGDKVRRLRAALSPWVSLAEWLVANAGKEELGAGIQEMLPALRSRIDESRAALAESEVTK